MRTTGTVLVFEEEGPCGPVRVEVDAGPWAAHPLVQAQCSGPAPARALHALAVLSHLRHRGRGPWQIVARLGGHQIRPPELSHLDTEQAVAALDAFLGEVWVEPEQQP